MSFVHEKLHVQFWPIFVQSWVEGGGWWVVGEKLLMDTTVKEVLFSQVHHNSFTAVHSSTDLGRDGPSPRADDDAKLQ